MSNEKKQEQIQGLTPEQQKAFDRLSADPNLRADAEALKVAIIKFSKMLWNIESSVVRIMDVYKRSRE